MACRRLEAEASFWELRRAVIVIVLTVAEDWSWIIKTAILGTWHKQNLLVTEQAK